MTQKTSTFFDEISALSRQGSLPQRVGQQLKAKIEAQDLVPGQKLPTELELSKAFGVSRNVIREAIATLKLNGYIEIRRGIGTFICESLPTGQFTIDPENLLDRKHVIQIYQLRIEIESGAAGLAAESRTPSQLKKISQALSRVDKAAGDWEKGASTAADLHMAIGEASNNVYFERLMRQLERSIHEAVRTVRYSTIGSDRLIAIEQEHHLIFDAIASKNGDLARQAMRAHLTNAMNRYAQLSLKGKK